MITYSQPEVAEVVASKDEWFVLPPLPAKPVCTTACEAEVKEWFTKDQINNYLRDLAWYMSHHPAPVAANLPTLADRFREQAEKWQNETQHLSSPIQKAAHPSYQAVLGMAAENKQEIIRLLIRDLQQNRRMWFWALSYLTQDNPIKPQDAEKIDKMIDAWTTWGKDKGIA